MPPTADEYRAGVLQLLKQQRASLTSLIEQIDGTLAYDWSRGMGVAAALYGPILDQYARDLAALRAAEDDPAARLGLDWLTGQHGKLASISASVQASADKYGANAARTITNAQRQATEMAASDAAQLTQRSLWPAVEGAGVPPSVLFNRPNPDAISQWVGRAGNGHPLGDLFEGFGAEATQGARQAMMLGLLTGANPKAMASGIANALGISRSRATIISRTEVLGSYRSAAHETYRANSDVLNGWMWSAGGANPCAMCMGMDGLQFSLEEELIDHPCGKCAPIPITKSWGDILGPLGIDTSDMEETSMGAEGAYETGPEKFARMSPQQQRAIIGTKTGYEAYQRGEVELKDFIGKRAAEDGFPASYYQKSLKEMEIPTGRPTPSNRMVEPNPRFTRPGGFQPIERGMPIPVDEMPKWAQQSEASRAAYQIMRNGLPYNMSQHELPLLRMNLEEMLKGDLPLNVRLAALRQIDVIDQYNVYIERYVSHVTTGASTLGRAPEFVYKPSRELERALAAARAGERGALEQVAAEAAAREADVVAAHEAEALTISRETAAAERGARTLTGDELRAEADEMHTLLRPDLAEFTTYEERTQQEQQYFADKAALLKGNPAWQRYVERLDVPPYADMTRDEYGVVQLEAAFHAYAGSDATTVALQDIARDLYGLPSTEAHAISADVRAAAARLVERDGGALRAYLQATYQQTQQWFDEHGITEITLYRGSSSADKLEGLAYRGQATAREIAGQPFASWTVDPSRAMYYAGLNNEEYRRLIAVHVPVSEVFGTPFTARANLTESEFLLLGHTEDGVVLSWRAQSAQSDIDKILDKLAASLNARS